MMMIILIIISTIAVVFAIVSTQTLYLHQRPDKEILTKEFSTHHDFWSKKEGNKSLLIMLHGMYSHPSIFNDTAQKVLQNGWDSYAPILPNASKSYEDLTSQQAYLWEDSLKVAFQRSLIHNQGYTKIVLAGHSQGGALALTIAPSLSFLNGLISVATPMNLIHKKNSVIRNIGIMLSGLLVFLIPKKGLSTNNKYYKERKLVENHGSPQEFHFGLTLHSMNLGLKKTRQNLHHITIPCLLIHEKEDKTAIFEDLLYVKKRINSSSIKEVLLDTPLSIDPYSKRHKIFTYIHTKNQVAQEIVDFLKTL